MTTNKMSLKEAIDKYGNREIDEEKLKGLLKPVEPVGRFKPSRGDKYFFVRDDGNWDSDYWSNDGLDMERYEIDNCFPTKEAAEFKIEKQNFFTLMKDYAGSDWWKPKQTAGHYNWRILYNHSNETLGIASSNGHQTGDIYFQSEEDAQYIIDNYHDELLKYYFEVEK